MNNTVLINHLKNIDIFKNVNEDILTSLLPELTTISLTKETILFHQNDPSDALYIVLQGKLVATTIQKYGKQTILAEIIAGDIVGEINLFAGGKRTANVSAVTDVELIKLSKTAFENIVAQHPVLLQKMAEVITKRLRRNQLLAILPKYFGETDDNVLNAIESQAKWVHLSSGETLFKQGDIADCLYALVSGRLKVAITNSTDNQQIIGEVSQGEVVGEMALFADETRTADVYALRDCDLVKLSTTAFEKLAQKYPQLMMAITKLVVQRSRQDIRSTSKKGHISNITIVPLNSKVLSTEFCQRITKKLANFGPTLYLNSQRLDNFMDIPKASQITKNSPHSIRLNAWLDEQESQHRFTIYTTDLEATEWSKWCLRRADQILLVADAETSPSISDIEKELLMNKNRVSVANQTLILLHSNSKQLPTGTQHWLSQRKVQEHHHIRWDTENDFGKLARFISGHAVGLVFSGGGARGFAHFGVFLALKEAGIPIDMIGGTSMGGHIGAQCAAEWDRETMLRINHKGLVEMNPYKAYRLPIVSLLGSSKMKASSRMAFKDSKIEDLWINFFCISSNLSTYKMMIHRTGNLEKAIRATTAIPGISEPVPENGNLLIDGGILNNLPGDIIRQFCSTVIVVDIAGQINLTTEYENMPSTWEILWNRFLPFKKNIQVPSILSILLGTALIGSNDRANKVRADADFYLKPPVGNFKMLDFAALDELVEVGYQYTKKEIAKWGEKIGKVTSEKN